MASLERLFELTEAGDKRILVTRDQLTEEEEAKFLFVFGAEAMSHTKNFLVDRTPKGKEE